MVGRTLENGYDYSRDFPTIAIDNANAFNEAARALEGDPLLREGFNKVFGNYNTMSVIYETMKAGAIEQRLKEHLALGRQIVIFHRRVNDNKNLAQPPFASALQKAIEAADPRLRGAAMQSVAAFKAKYADLLKWEQTLDYRMPRAQISSILGDTHKYTPDEMRELNIVVEKNLSVLDLLKPIPEAKLKEVGTILGNVTFDIEDLDIVDSVCPGRNEEEEEDAYRKRIKDAVKRIDVVKAAMLARLKEREKNREIDLKLDANGKKIRNVGLVAGSDTNADKKKDIERFQNDDDPMKVIVVQEASGKEGISLHDKTGKHMRVEINLALPQSPISFIQQEGRIYRLGQKSNAIFEYPLLGIDNELSIFAGRFNQQASTTENLALGSRARGLRKSISRGVLSRRGVIPVQSQGLGGKDFDKADENRKQGYDAAVEDYEKDKGKMMKGETPAPIAFKMAEAAGLSEGDKVLEPSAGRGIILQYIPSGVRSTSIEPETELSNELMLSTGGVPYDAPSSAARMARVFTGKFEDFSTVNKFDAAIMAPPEGKEHDHVSKALQHMEAGSRIVALVSEKTVGGIQRISSFDDKAKVTAEVKLPAFFTDGTSKRIIVIDIARDAASASKLPKAETIDLSNETNETRLLEKIGKLDLPKRSPDITAKWKKMGETFASAIMADGGIVSKSKYSNGINTDYERISFSLNSSAFRGLKRYLPDGTDISVSTYITFDEIKGLDAKVLKRYVTLRKVLEMNATDAVKAKDELSQDYYGSKVIDKSYPQLITYAKAYTKLVENITGLSEDRLARAARGEAIDLNEKMESGKAYSSKELSGLFHITAGDDIELLDMFDRVMRPLKEIGISAVTYSEPDSNTFAYFSMRDNKLHINASVWNSSKIIDERGDAATLTNAKRAEVLCHELIHAVSAYSLRYLDYPSEYGNMKLWEEAKRAENLYNTIISNPQVYTLPYYCKSNVDELFAEMASPAVRRALQAIPIWKKTDIVGKPARFRNPELRVSSPGSIGCSSTSAYNAMEEVLQGIIKNFDKPLFELYANAVNNGELSQPHYEAMTFGRDNDDLEEVNKRFNDELQQQIDGKQEKGHIYRLGRPCGFLQAAGIPDLPIELPASQLLYKATSGKHDFDLHEVMGLPQAINNPIATFEYGDKKKSQNILTMISHNGENFIVGMFIKPTVNGKVLEVNSVRNVFPKNGDSIIRWINQGKLTNTNKKELLNFLDQQRTNHADVAFVLPDEQVKQRNTEVSSAAKVIENFENPTLRDENDADILYRTSAEIDAEYPDWLDGTTTDSGKHTTQVEGTRKTYNKVGDWIEAQLGKDVSILDASSGMGYGTEDLRKRGFNIEDVEPYQSDERKKNNPATYSSYGDISGRYDYIISNAVLNVVPDDVRANVLHDMAGRLKVGGRMFINTRKAGEEKSIKDKVELDSPQEVLVKRNGKIASYQRFYTPAELRDWVQGELGDGYSVKLANESNSGTKGLAAVVVTKVADDINDRIKGRVLNLFHDAVEGKLSGKPIEIGELTSEGRDYLSKLSGKDMKDIVSFVINPSDLRHIYNNHYAENEKDKGSNYPLDDNDIKSMVDVITSPDKIVYLNEGGLNKFIFLSESPQNGAYNLVEVYSDRHGHLTAKSLYNTKKGVSQRAMTILEQSKLSTSKTDGATLSSTKVPNLFDTRKSESALFREGTMERSGAATASEQVKALAQKLHLDNVEVRETTEGLEGRKARAKGFFDKNTGKIVIVMSNNIDADDAVQTLLHEGVAHYGLRQLFGEHFDAFLDNVYKYASIEVRQKIAQKAMRNGLDFRTATEEYLATLAETTDFEAAKKNSWWRKIKALFMDMLDKLGLTHFNANALTDNELRYILWKSYENLQNRGDGIFALAADIAKQLELKVGEYAERTTPLERENKELEDIVRSAKADGTFMKAPNGKPSHLTERQWAQVRTKAFKKWFGDWEKAARIEKLRTSEPIVATGNEYEGKYELNNKSAAQYIINSLRGEYTNKDTGGIIKLSRRGAEKVTRHDAESEIHLKSFALIPQMIENAIFIEEEENEKEKNGFDSYRYYVVGLKIDGVDYTAKLAVGVKDNAIYYDHALTEIEKGNLIDNIGLIKRRHDSNEESSGIKDKRLLSILQNNSSKVVDENGEPLVVRHYTNSEFSRFDIKKAGENTDNNATNEDFAKTAHLGFWFNLGGVLSGQFNREMDVFLLSKQPYNAGDLIQLADELSSYDNAEEKVRDLKGEGYDGITLKDPEFGGTSFVVFSPSQIKSATDNNGSFSPEDGDIRFRKSDAEITDNTLFRDGEKVNERFNVELQQQIDGKQEKGHIYKLGMPSQNLLSAGIENLPIELSADRLAMKASESYESKHPFPLESVMSLPKALNNPIAVFDSATKTGTKVVLTELQHNGNNFVVAISVRRDAPNRSLNVEINSIRSLYPKDSKNSLLDWVNKGLMKWVDKDKMKNFLSAQWPNYIAGGEKVSDNQELSSATKVVENFENPTQSAENDTLFRDGDEKGVLKAMERDADVQPTLALTPENWRKEFGDDAMVYTPLGKVKLGEHQYQKLVERKRESEFGMIRPTLSDPDVVIEKKAVSEGSERDTKYLFVKTFRKADGSRFVHYESVTVRKEGMEVSISSHEADAKAIEKEMQNGKILHLRKGLSAGSERYLTSTSDKKGPDLVPTSDNAKVVENFENPTRSAENDTLFRDGDEKKYQNALARDRYEKRMKSGMYQSREAMQDSMASVEEAMKAIMGKKWTSVEDVADFENAYLGENRLSSVNKAEVDDFARRLFKPMLKAVSDLAKTADERSALIDYMFAKHGLERNTFMAERDAKAAYANYQKKHPKGNKTLQDFIDKYREKDYAGLTTLTECEKVAQAEYEAQMFVDDYERSHDTKELWEKVNAVNNAILAKSYECGMMDKATFDKISSMYEHYIPLRGFDETTSDEAYAYLQDSHSSFNQPIRTAMGRKSKADDPFANMQQMAESGIMQGNRNKLVKQKFLNFVLNHPSDLVSVSELWLKFNDVTNEWEPTFPKIEDNDAPAEVERKMQEFEERMNTLAAQDPLHYYKTSQGKNIPYRVIGTRDLRQHQVLVKRNGKDYVLTVNGNPRLAQAINGQTNPDNDLSGMIGAALGVLSNVNRQLSSFYTTKNPDFIISNYLRDMLYSNAMAWVKERPNYALRFHANVAKANPAVMKLLFVKLREDRLDMNNPFEKAFNDFIINGGETGYSNARDIEQHKSEIDRELKRNNGQLPLSTALDWAGERFDEYNRGIENSARFAAFLTSREFGRSIGRAVYDAKEVSVNFNKKGSGWKFYGSHGQTWLGSTSAAISGAGRAGFVFWNAAVQGTTNFGRAFSKHPAKAFTAAASLFILGALMAHLGGSGDGDDEDKNAYYNLPDYVRRSNLLFRKGDSWISIPLPVEFRAIYGLGELMSSALSGKEHLNEGEMAEAIASQMSQMLPLDFMEGGGGANAFIPSSVKPFVEAQLNMGWTGLPLYKDTDYNKNDPQWTKAYKNADKYIVATTKALNEATGGDKYTKGGIDLNSAKIEYMLNGYFGGVSGTIEKLVKTAETIAGSRDYEHRNTPILNRILKSGDERTEARAINNEYQRLKEEYEKTGRRLRGYEHDTDNDIFDFAEKIDFIYNSPEFTRYEIFKDFNKEIIGIYDELKDVSDEGERKELEDVLVQIKKELIEAVNESRESK